MGEIADDMINGLSCQLCGVYFQEEHGYSVVCHECYCDLSNKEKKQYEEAEYDEI